MGKLSSQVFSSDFDFNFDDIQNEDETTDSKKGTFFKIKKVITHSSLKKSGDFSEKKGK
jgi:hypothetical protein